MGFQETEQLSRCLAGLGVLAEDQISVSNSRGLRRWEGATRGPVHSEQAEKGQNKGQQGSGERVGGVGSGDKQP